MTGAERDLALALVRRIAERLRSEASLLELVLDVLEAEDAAADGFDAAERQARAEGRLVVAPPRFQ